jgi:hypothetical protein
MTKRDHNIAAGEKKIAQSLRKWPTKHEVSEKRNKGSKTGSSFMAAFTSHTQRTPPSETSYALRQDL